jgi:hypothetical protein
LKKAKNQAKNKFYSLVDFIKLISLYLFLKLKLTVMKATNTIPLLSYLRHLLPHLLKLNTYNLPLKSIIKFNTPTQPLTDEGEMVNGNNEKLSDKPASNPNPIPENQTAKWVTNKVASTLNPELFRAFVHSLLPGFRLPGFIKLDEAEKIANNINGYVEEYKTAPGVGKAGETMVEHPHDFDEYAEFAAIWKDPNITIPEREHLVNEVCGFLTRNTGYPFVPLKYKGVEGFFGLFRKINTGAGWHLDNVTADSIAFSSRKINFQGSIVLHLKVPKKGGETIISNRQAQNGDMKFLNPDGWTYDEKMLDGIMKVEVPCFAGDLIILSTLNYHMVKPCLEVGAERISFSMFLVIFEDEPNTIYIYN